MNADQNTCKICQTPSPVFYRDSRVFYKCPECWLIFTHDTVAPTAAEQHYKGQWAGSGADFWQQQVSGLLSYINRYRVPQRILDFGSGSGAMTDELRRRGFDVTPLEPMFHGFLSEQKYPHKFDVVVAIEVIEHLPDPWKELREIEKVLTDDGIAVFSSMLTDSFIKSASAEEQFSKWWYKDDLTHLTFFCIKALSKLADIGNYGIDIYDDKVFVIRR